MLKPSLIEPVTVPDLLHDDRSPLRAELQAVIAGAKAISAGQRPGQGLGPAHDRPLCQALQQLHHAGMDDKRQVFQPSAASGVNVALAMLFILSAYWRRSQED
jgi:hypothetical protein